MTVTRDSVWEYTSIKVAEHTKRIHVSEKIFNGERCRKRFLNLLPPFLLSKPVRSSVQEHVKTPEDVTDVDPTRRASQEATIDYCVSKYPVGRFHDAENHRGEIAEKSFFLCEEDCRTNDLTCQKPCDRLDEETESFAEITDGELYDALVPHDEDYQGWEDDFEEDETDRSRREKRNIGWPLERCESYTSLSEHEDEPDTTDPYLSHKLYYPYSRILRPRYFTFSGKNLQYEGIDLPRRPRSPVRRILPGAFDVKATYEEWSGKRRIRENRRCLRESKERVSLSLRRLNVDQTNENLLVSSLVVQTICEEVVLSSMDAKIDVNIHTFVNIAVVWALSEFENFNYQSLIEAFVFSKDFELYDGKRESDVIDMLGIGGMRRTLAGVYRPPCSPNVYTTLHRRLPWQYVSPSHERGQPKLYPNVRERIEEKTQRINGGDGPSTYVPDVTCFHLREILDKSYVAYRRKSKSLVLSSKSSVKLIEKYFLQLVSLV